MPLYNKIKCISLQVQKPKEKKGKIRALLFASSKGSLTIEAALLLPLFLLIISSIMYFLVIFNLQMNIQSRLENTARDISKAAYLTEDLKIFNYVYLRSSMMNSEVKEMINNSNILGKSEGIHFYESEFFNQEGILDLVTTYEMVIPFIPEKIISFPCVQRARIRTWIGKNIDGEDMQGGETVFVTPTGTVYHRNRDCSHLKLSISEKRFKDIHTLRNNQGGKYYRCSLCGEEFHSPNDIVYVTSEGDCWHSSVHCSGLKRTILEIDISEVGTKSACSRCGGEEP